MATKKCPNGHQYDTSIYGDQCPFCPSKKVKPSSSPSTPLPKDFTDGEETIVHLNPVHPKEEVPLQKNYEVKNEGRTIIRTKEESPVPVSPRFPEPEPTKETPASNTDRTNEGHTIIKTKKASQEKPPTTRHLVGLLVSYDANPAGEVYKLYEGRNVIGRSSGANISFPSDNFMSSQHLLILYKDGSFEAIDLNSSNHSYLNGNPFDQTFLRMNDVLSIGNTKLIFFPIPRI